MNLEIAMHAAREVGEMLKENFGKRVEVESKPDRTLVSSLDRLAERMITGRLHDAFPTHAIVGEEGGGSVMGDDYTWIIDPLDGTHNYLRRIPVYGVSIGLMYRQEFVAGVIYMPVEGELYSAEKGGGAWKNGKRIAVSDTGEIDRCAMGFDSGFRSETGKKIYFLEKFASQVANIRMSGSSARNLTFLAEGITDLVIEFDDRIWDYAAAVTLIREAGGRMTSHEGGPVQGDRACYIASNGLLHDAAKRLLER